MNTLLQWLLITALIITLAISAASWYKSRLLALTGDTVSKLR